MHGTLVTRGLWSLPESGLLSAFLPPQNTMTSRPPMLLERFSGGYSPPAASFVRALALGALAFLLLSAPALADGGKMHDKVRLQLKWRHQFQFAGYYAALEQGYYREAGLDVEILPAQPDEDPMGKVINGTAEYGVGTTELLLRRQQGAPVVVLAAIFQHSPLALLVKRQRDLSSLHDLAGKPVMIEAGSSELYAYLRREGLPMERLQLAGHTFNPQDIISGKVAAMSVYVTDEPFLLRELGVAYLLHSPREGGIDFYGDNLFTTEAELHAHPERVKAFREASLRGWDYAMRHPEEIVQLIHNRYGSPHTPNHLRFEAEQMVPLMRADLLEIGHMYPGRWRHIAEVYAELGMLQPQFDLRGFLYDPNPPPVDLRRFFWVMGILAVLLLLAGAFALVLRRANTRLREARRIAEGTLDEQREFMAMISHEFRSPLAAIDSAAQVLAARGEGEDKIAARIRRSVARLSTLIDNCLTADRFDTRSWQMKTETIDPRTFLPPLVDQTTALAPRHHVELSVAPATPPAFAGDPNLLRIMLLNLLDNAIKYSPDGGPITLCAQPGKRGGLLLAVEDCGIGIPPEERGKVLNRYFRGRQAGSSQGAGLGLFLVERVVAMHGGSIDVDSEPGHGTTISVHLPLQTGDGSAAPRA